MNKLIIAEKPSVAVRISSSLAEGSSPRRFSINGVSYFEVPHGTDVLYVVAAAGHLFSLHQKGDSNKIPVFDVEWIESYKVRKSAYFTKKYLDTIIEIGKKCSFFINACDYDLEGTVIGSNIIKAITKKNANSEVNSDNVSRMRFSTTTNLDLLNAYDNISDFDFNNLYAGETRHTLDWLWGINLSRALMHAIATSGHKAVLSIGRVQGPTLSVLANREMEIKDFVSKPYWRLFVSFGGVDFENSRGNILEKDIAQDLLNKTKEGVAIVDMFNTTKEDRYPFPPFDLTSLQLEASRVFRIDPSKTLAIAQTLYEHAYISYPRTSSQKLPYSLNLKRIISQLAKNPTYAEDASKLINAQRFKPREGQKDDEAHPAIYPTGEIPKKLGLEEGKVYDLIARRFLACFAEPAKIEKTNAVLKINNERYLASGDVVVNPGWTTTYTYHKFRESKIPRLSVGENITISDAKMDEGMTTPPKRYGKASLIALLEQKDLGTKATRSAIIDTLFDRGYIKNSSIEVTEFGMSVYNALNKYCPQILDPELTNKLESEMSKIAKGELSKDTVINDGKSVISDILAIFMKNEKEIGTELGNGLKETEMSNVLGKCKCGGNLVIKRSRNNKTFVGCSNWPNCSVTYPIPQYAKIIPLHKTCDICGTPKIKVFSRGKVFDMDLDPNCETKQKWKQRTTESKETKSKPAVKKPAKKSSKKPSKKKKVSKS